MPREIQSDGKNLIFKDYLNRSVSIAHDDYLDLMRSEERRLIRPALEECLADPTEVWWSIETVEGKDYSYYKYFKFYKNLVFLAYVLIDESLHFHLNNFYGFNENEDEKADRERCGQLILSKP
jgi:hypothetical protein